MSKKFHEGKDELKFLSVFFRTTTAAEDIDLLLIQPLERPIRVRGVRVMFFALDTYASGVDLNLQTDTGTTETEIANYDTVGGESATAVKTVYDFTLSNDQRVEVGEWLQLQIDDDEDAACGGVVQLEYVELEV